jgi:spore maturation protein SpmB
LAVYFGAVQVRRIRHSLAAGLTADIAGVIFAVLACSFFSRIERTVYIELFIFLWRL